MKNKIKIFVLVILIVLLLASLYAVFKIFNQNSLCTFNYNDEVYSLEKKVIIKYNNEILEEIKYKSKFDEILAEEKKDLERKNYEIIEKENEINARKVGKSKLKYYKTVNNYKKDGFSCNLRLFK